MAYRSLEDTLEDLRTVLKANLPSKLVTIQEERGDNLVVPAPGNYSYYISNNIYTVPDVKLLPVVYLMGWNEVIVARGEQNWDQWLFDLAIRAILSGREQETLAKMVYRYADAIVRILGNEFAALENVLDVRDVRVDYSTVSPTTPLLQGVEVSCRVLAIREYGDEEA